MKLALIRGICVSLSNSRGKWSAIVISAILPEMFIEREIVLGTMAPITSPSIMSKLTSTVSVIWIVTDVFSITVRLSAISKSLLSMLSKARAMLSVLTMCALLCLQTVRDSCKLRSQKRKSLPLSSNGIFNDSSLPLHLNLTAVKTTSLSGLIEVVENWFHSSCGGRSWVNPSRHAAVQKGWSMSGACSLHVRSL